MRLHELIFQGLFGTEKPVRITAEDGIARVPLPSGVTTDDVQYLLISLLYPDDTPYSLRSEYARGDGIKIAAKFDHRDRLYRIVRKAPSSSVRLQVQESSGWRDVETGASEVGRFLRQSLELPPLQVFWSLNLWRYDQSADAATTVDIDALDDRVRDVIQKYRAAHEVEKVEDAIKDVESQISDAKKALGRGAKLEEKLRGAREKLDEIAVEDLTLEDLELMRNKDDVIRDYEEQLDRLADDEHHERMRLDETLPESWARSPLFWVGAVVGVVSILVSVAFKHDLRMIALLDIGGFLACAWVLINYFGDLEQANVHQIRLESIKRRMNQVREELISMQERIDHVLVHVGASDERELEQRLAKTHKLQQIIDKMEEEVEAMRRDPDYLAAVEEVNRLEGTFRELQERRKELPSTMMSAYQLETDLEAMGFEPKHLLEPQEDDVEDDARPQDRILQAASSLGFYEDGVLDDKIVRMWQKISGHVLGERFASSDIIGGELHVGDLNAEQIEMWKRTRPSEFQIFVKALAVATQVNVAGSSRRGRFQSVVAQTPEVEMTSSQAAKFREVLSSAALKSGFVLLIPGA